MRLRWWMIPLAWAVVCFLGLAWALHEPTPAMADVQTCPVVSTAPDGKGGTNVTYDCGLKDANGNLLYLTIDQPKWP